MSASVATQAQYTPEDLLAMPDGKSYELVGGHIVERNMGAESSWVGGRLLSRLNEDDDLSGEDIIPGFRCPLHEIFLPREPSPDVAERPSGHGS